MQERPESNQELQTHDIFEVFNPYFLLFFSLSCIMSSVFIQQVFISFQQMRLGIALSPVLGIVAPMFLLTRRFRPGFQEQFRIRGVTLRFAALVVVGTVAMVVIVDYVYILAQYFMPAPVDYLDGIKELKPDGSASFIGTFVGLCVIVPISEEIIFRGVIQHVFTRNMGAAIGVALASVFFGVIHFNPQLLISMTAFGVFVGLTFLWTQNLTYAIIAHAVLNTVAFLQLTMGGDDESMIEPFYVQSSVYAVVALVVVFLTLREIKKGAPATGSTPFDSQSSNDVSRD